MIQLTLGPLAIQLEGIDKEQMPAHTLLFLSDNAPIDVHYRIEIGGSMPAFPSQLLYRKKDIVVFRKEGGLESRLLLFPGRGIPYAYYDEIDETHVTISFNPHFTDFLQSDTCFHSLLALERHLNRKHDYILHCSYLDFQGKAYLFSGPSGIGKTTHTNLWCKLYPQDARVLNGDKCLLVKEGNRFYALGWPVCGSSGICHNERREVAALVLLQQTPRNEELVESRARQFKRVLEQLAVNYWDASFVEQAVSFAEQLTGAVTCCTYGCTMDDAAATTLYTILQHRIHEKE